MHRFDRVLHFVLTAMLIGFAIVPVQGEPSAREAAFDSFTYAGSDHRAPASAGDNLSLHVKADINALDLEWPADGKEWAKFTAPDGIKPITVEAAGGGLHFTGAVVGPHTRGSP